MTVDKTLAERGNRYGDIAEESRISQSIIQFLQSLEGWQRLDDTMRHCLTMDAVKTARILNGDPTYPDNWHDKAGYATLAEKHVSTRRLPVNMVEELLKRDEHEARNSERTGAGPTSGNDAKWPANAYERGEHRG